MHLYSIDYSGNFDVTSIAFSQKTKLKKEGKMMNKNSLCQNQTKYIGLKNRKHTIPQAKCAELWSCEPVTRQ